MTAEVVGIWVTAVAVVVATFYAIWRGRPSASTPFYQELKASDKDSDKYHWVQLAMPNLYTNPSVIGLSPQPCGKVVDLDGMTVTVDHPTKGNQTATLQQVHTVRRLQLSKEEKVHGDWTPHLNSERVGEGAEKPRAPWLRFRATR